MKILMINHFPLTGSGSGTYTRNLAVHLTALGHEVSIVLPENMDHFTVPDGVRIHPVFFTPEDGSHVNTKKPADGRSMETALPFNFPCFTSHPRSTLSFGDLNEDQLAMYTDVFRSAIQEEIDTFRPDIIHGQHVWILPALAADSGIPMILTAHGTDLMGYDKWPDLRNYAQAAINACDTVISISKDNAALIEARFPENKHKIALVRNGYDPTIFYPEALTPEEVLGKYYNIVPEDWKDRRIITFAGKLTYFKGVDILLEAARIYEQRDPASLTLIIGDGDERDNLRFRARDLKLKTVRFLGNVEQSELRRLYNIADVSLVPSRREPFGLVAIEAMGCGIPIIASNQGGLPDFVNNTVGRLVEPGDPADLADKVTEVLNITKDGADHWRRDIADYARSHYAQDAIIREVEKLYKDIIDRRKQTA
ncbi:MAG: glycosyltransferase family 4 protein [Solobacterium sp.]|nr:glycosyltransferase family 4 protein [Solobacterium sp.]